MKIYIILLAVLFTSASSIFVRLSIMPPLVLAFYRMVFSTLFLLIPLLLKNRESLRLYSKGDLALSLASGTALALHFAAWISSLSYTSVAASTVLVSLSPVFVALIGWIMFRQKPGKVFALCLLGAISGTVLIAFDGGFDEAGGIFGNALALGGAFFVGIYLMLGGHIRKRIPTNAYAAVVYGMSAVLLLIIVLVSGQPLWGYSSGEFLLVAAFALVCSIGGHTLYNMLLKHFSPSTIAVSTLGEPVFATVLAILILGEFPRLLTIGGGALILCALAVYLIRERK